MSKVCLYKYDSLGGKIHGFKCRTVIVSVSEIDEYTADGWRHSPREAADIDRPNNVELTREQLEDKANELGIVFDKRIKDKTLFERIKQHINSKAE